MTDHTPTTEDMKEQFVAGAMVTGFAYTRNEARTDFNRWLNAVKAQALEEFAEIWATGEWSDWFLAENVTCDVTAVQATDKALRERAQQIRGGK